MTDWLNPIRLGMLSEEPVPHADTILAALAKHLEAKLSFGKDPAALSFPHSCHECQRALKISDMFMKVIPCAP